MSKEEKEKKEEKDKKITILINQTPYEAPKPVMTGLLLSSASLFL